MDGILVRRFVKEDMEDYLSLCATVSSGSWNRMDEERIRTEMESPEDLGCKKTHLVAFHRQKIIGSTISRIDPIYLERNGPFPYIAMVVDAHYDRRTVGSELLDNLESVLYGEFKGMDAYVNSDDLEFRGFLESRGFSIKGSEYCRMGLSFGESPQPFFPDGFSLRRPVIPRDIPKIVEAMNTSFSTNPRHIPFSIPYISSRNYMLKANEGGAFLLENDGRIVGTVFNFIDRDIVNGSPEKTGGIYALGIDPFYRGLGLAKELLHLSLGWIGEMGVKRAYLYMDTDNRAALCLYASMGFKVMDKGMRYRNIFPQQT